MRLPFDDLPNPPVSYCFGPELTAEDLLLPACQTSCFSGYPNEVDNSDCIYCSFTDCDFCHLNNQYD